MYYAWLCDIIIFLLETQSFYCYSSSQTSFCSWEQIKISRLFVGSFHPPSPLLQSPSSLPINSSEPFSPSFTCYCSSLCLSLQLEVTFICPTPNTLSLLPQSLQWPSFRKSYFNAFSSFTEVWLSAVFYKAMSQGVLTKINCIVPVNMYLASWNNRNTLFKNCLK